MDKGGALMGWAGGLAKKAAGSAAGLAEKAVKVAGAAVPDGEPPHPTPPFSCPPPPPPPRLWPSPAPAAGHGQPFRCCVRDGRGGGVLSAPRWRLARWAGAAGGPATELEKVGER